VGKKTAEEIAGHFERQRLLATQVIPATDYTDEHGSNINK